MLRLIAIWALSAISFAQSTQPATKEDAKPDEKKTAAKPEEKPRDISPDISLIQSAIKRIVEADKSNRNGGSYSWEGQYSQIKEVRSGAKKETARHLLNFCKTVDDAQIIGSTYKMTVIVGDASHILGGGKYWRLKNGPAVEGIVNEKGEQRKPEAQDMLNGGIEIACKILDFTVDRQFNSSKPELTRLQVTNVKILPKLTEKKADRPKSKTKGGERREP